MFKLKKTAVIPPDLPEADDTENTMPEAVEEQGKKKSFRMSAAFAFALCAVLCAVSQVTPVLAADASAAVLDMDLASQLINLIKAVNTLFTVFPINIFMMGSLLLLGLRIFRGAKKTATK